MCTYLYICKPNITTPKTREALSVGPSASGVGGVHFLFFSGVGTCEFEFLEAIPKELVGGRLFMFNGVLQFLREQDD